MDWFVGHWAEVAVVLLGVLRIAEVVVKWTDTETDDKVVSVVKGAYDKLFGKR